MKKKNIIIITSITIMTIAFAISFGKTYSKYILTRHFETTFSSLPFYFEVEDVTNEKIKAQPNQVVKLNIKNYLGDQSNKFDTEYTITLEDNGIFTLKPIKGTIKALEKGKTENLNLELKQDFTQTGGNLNISS